MKAKYKSRSIYGDEWEQELFTMLDNASIPYRKEQTLSDSKRRGKDKGCDIECIMDDVSIFIEAKTLEDYQSLAYNNYNYPDKSKNSLKYHQICRMDYLLIKVRPNKRINEVQMYAILKYDFVMWAARERRKQKFSITLKEIIEIGTLITDLEWLKGVKNEHED